MKNNQKNAARPQHKGEAFKGPARGQCLNCMDEQEYDLTVPVNKEPAGAREKRKKTQKR